MAVKQYGIPSMQLCSFLSTQLLFQFWPSCYHGCPVGCHYPALKIKFSPPWLPRDLLTSLKPETVPQ